MSGRLENSKARNIRLVGLDLDGTVFTDEKTITPATKDAIARAVRAGVAVLPVTGRPRSGLPEEVLAIPGVRYAITSNGAMCEDLAEGSVLVRLAMDEETALRALHIAEKYDVVIDIYIDGQAYTAAESMQLVQTHVPESFRPYFLKTRRLVENREQLLRRKGRGAEKFTILFRDMAQRAAAWQEFEQTGLFELSGGIPENIEVNAKGVDKGRALLALAGRLGFSRGQTMACGDASNDIAMLRAAWQYRSKHRRRPWSARAKSPAARPAQAKHGPCPRLWRSPQYFPECRRKARTGRFAQTPARPPPAGPYRGTKW